MALSPAAHRKSIHQNKLIIESIRGNIERLAKEIVDYAIEHLKDQFPIRIPHPSNDASALRNRVYRIELASQLGDPPEVAPTIKFYDMLGGNCNYEHLSHEEKVSVALFFHDLLFLEDKP